jgi:MYXO-CTERM domain-containing protein
MRRAAPFLLLLLSASPAVAEVRYDREQSGGGADPRVTYNMTVGQGSNRYLVVVVGLSNGAARASSVTFGGSRLTIIDSAGDRCHLQMWGMAAPPPGTFPVAIDITAPTNPVFSVAVAYTGVDQQAPIRDHVNLAGTTTGSSASPTTATGDMLVDGICVSGLNGQPSDGPNQVLRTGLNGTNFALAASDKPGTPGAAMTWQIGAELPWAVTALSLRAASSLDAAADTAPAIDGPSPDAAPDLRPTVDAPPPDVPSDVSSDDAAPDAPLPDASVTDARRATAHLTVGCACTTGGRSDGAPLSLLVVLALAALRRRSRA